MEKQQKPQERRPRNRIILKGTNEYSAGREVCNGLLREGKFDPETRQKVVSLRDWFRKKEIDKIEVEDSAINSTSSGSSGL